MPKSSSQNGFDVTISQRWRLITALEDSQIELDVFTAIGEHGRQIDLFSKNVKKNSPETAVSVVSLPDNTRLCVKHYKNRGLAHSVKGIFRPTHGIRALRYGTLLFETGLTSAIPMALVQKRWFGLVSDEWLIMSALEASLELDRYLVARIRSRWSYDEKQLFMEVFARFLSKLHESGAFHTDLKTCNILVSAPNPNHGATLVGEISELSFSLIDYDDVRYQKNGVGLKNRAKNLGQLFLSTPSDIDLDDRSRFLKLYLSACEKINDYATQLTKATIKRIRCKSLLYVGPDGDISEDWPSGEQWDYCSHILDEKSSEEV